MIESNSWIYAQSLCHRYSIFQSKTKIGESCCPAYPAFYKQ